MHWKSTFDTPGITLSPNNTLTVCGKSIMEDPYSFYQPVIKKLFYFQNHSLTIELDLKTINAGSKKQIFRILNTAKENSKIKTLNVLWLSDPSDEEGYDLGKELESITGIPFAYLEFA